MDSFGNFLSNPGNLPVIAILSGCSICAIAIVCGTVTKIAQMVIKHRERMARIEQGLDPDVPKESRSTFHGTV